MKYLHFYKLSQEFILLEHLTGISHLSESDVYLVFHVECVRCLGKIDETVADDSF
jgi:hypothetical protein